MIDIRFIFVGLLFNFVGSVTYLIDTVKGRVKPNKVSWFLWALAPLIAFAAELKQGVGLQSLMTFAIGFGPLCILIASFFNKKSEWKISRLDLFCGAVSLIGLLLWYVTKVGNIAILFSIFADAIAAIPTIIKSYQAPETEDYKVFLFSAISAVITLLTIKTWTFANWGFPLYILLICLLLFALIKFQLGKVFRK